MHRAVAKKKILAQEMGQKKNSGRLKIPHPPHHFSNGPSLTLTASFNLIVSEYLIFWPKGRKYDFATGDGSLLVLSCGIRKQPFTILL